jgi:carbon-monoxide dehydrogenase medium subunit
MTPFEFHAPERLDQAFELLDRYGDEARVIAGGTALVILMRQRLVQPSALISLGRMPGLRGVQVENGSIRIGALTTQREAEVAPLVREHVPVLADTLRHVATIRIRNVATLGGNLAHADPNQDPPATLIALNAAVELANASGKRVVPLEEFFTDYYETVLERGEIVESIVIPTLPPRTYAVFEKFLPRTADDYATVAVAVTVTLDESGEQCQEVRIVLGSAGPTPIRARQAEAMLREQALADDAIRAVAEQVKSEVDPVSDIRGSAEYKRDMAAVWVRRCLAHVRARARAMPPNGAFPPGAIE